MSDPVGDPEPWTTLHQLIRVRMDQRGWSCADLERLSGRVLSRGRWQQLGSGVQLRTRPDPASLVVIARALEVDLAIVVRAAARGPGLGDRLPPTDPAALSEWAREAILALIRAVLDGGGPADPGGMSGTAREWPKATAPSRRAPDGTGGGGGD